MADIGLTIQTILAADAGVTALTTRIHSDFLPQPVSTRTALTVRVIDTLHTHTLIRDSGVARARIQIDSFAQTRTDANALAEAVRLALQSKHSGDNAGVFINEITLAAGDQQIIEPPETAGDQRRFVVSQDYFVFYRVTLGV